MSTRASAVLLRYAAVTGALAVAACQPVTAPTDNTLTPTAIPSAASGFRADEEASIKADAKARILKRTRIGAVFAAPELCSNYFSIGDPTIIDSTLGDQTGKVRLLFPVAVIRTINSGSQMVAPDLDCYGYSRPGWVINQPYPVTFEFQVEHWQTGWRVAQLQTNGF